jgi:hypothetical protein
MENQKISTAVGTGILVIFSVTVFAFVWKYEQISAFEYNYFLKSIPISTLKIIPGVNNDIEIQEGVKPVESIPVSWSTYTNKRLGFSLDIPEKIGIANYSAIKNCETMSPFRAFDDSKSNFVYFSSEDVPALSSKSCVKNSIPILSAAEHQGSKGVEYNYAIEYWKLFVVPIKQRNELDKTLRDLWGSDCRFTKGEYSSEKKLYDIRLDEGNFCQNKELPECRCAIASSRYYVKYSPDQKKAALWEYGGDDYFPLVPFDQILPEHFKDPGQFADIRMADSFRFIDSK